MTDLRRRASLWRWCLGLSAGAVLAGFGGVTPGTATAQPLTLVISPTTTSAPIRRDFLGLGLEFPTIPAWTGSAGAAVNSILINLTRQLAPDGSPVIRVGGVSTDRSWWPIAGVARSPGVTDDLGPAWMRDARTLVDGTNARLIIGLNLEADSIRLAQVEEAHFLAGLGRRHILAFEVGNEPELYSFYPWYKLASDGHLIPWDSRATGRPVFSRPRTFGVSDYTRQFTRFRQNLGDVPLAGLDSGSQYWLSKLPQFLAAEPGLDMITFHRYGLDGCQRDPAHPNFTSVAHLLTLFASRNLMVGITPAIAEAHAAGAQFRIDELNSAFCNGLAGATNTFASALWVLDTLFTMAHDGVDGINIHTFPQAASALFDFARIHGRWLAAVHPEYYGLLMFERAMPAGSRLLQVSSTSAGPLRTWASIAPDGDVHLLVINDSLTGPRTVRVQLPLARPAQPSATLLTAGDAAATSGVTLGGLSFGTTTVTGRLRHVAPGSSGLPAGFPYTLLPPVHTARAIAHSSGTPAYTVTLRRSSAELLTWAGGLRNLNRR